LNTNEPLTLKDFQEELIVSKNTVLKELKELREWFIRREIQLISRPRVGYYLEGGEKEKRNAIKELIVEILDTDIIKDITRIIQGTSKIDNGLYQELKSLFKNIDITYIENWMKFIEKTLGKEFVYLSYVNLVMYLLITIKRLQNKKEIRMTSENLVKIREYPEFQIVQSLARKIEIQFDINVSEDEIGYITLQLIGTKVQKDLNNQFQKETVAQLAYEMVEKFEKIYGVLLENKKDLIHNLILHLRPAIHRLKFKINIDNPLMDDIKNQYKSVYEATVKVIKILE
jgi:transcriptional antiterminator